VTLGFIVLQVKHPQNLILYALKEPTVRLGQLKKHLVLLELTTISKEDQNAFNAHKDTTVQVEAVTLKFVRKVISVKLGLHSSKNVNKTLIILLKDNFNANLVHEALHVRD